MMKITKRQSLESDRFFIIGDDGITLALCKNEDTADAFIDIYNQHFALREVLEQLVAYRAIHHKWPDEDSLLMKKVQSVLAKVRGEK
jgi:hypothetical protein